MSEPVISGFTADEIDTICADVLRAADECFAAAAKCPQARDYRLMRGDMRYELATKIRAAIGTTELHTRKQLGS